MNNENSFIDIDLQMQFNEGKRNKTFQKCYQYSFSVLCEKNKLLCTTCNTSLQHVSTRNVLATTTENYFPR